MITALCGGVGGSKLASGLYQTVPPDELAVIVNTADDLEFWGLHVSPDLDTVTYTLAGLAQREFGWGIEGDTFVALAMMASYGADDWFRVGDRDLATDVFRTEGLRSGQTLSEITATITRALGVHARVLPMTDGMVATRLLVQGEWLEFQDYFVRRRHRDAVEAVIYHGLEEAPMTAGVEEAFLSAEVLIIVNSNPVLSILPILGVPGINDLLVTSSAPRVAVSPIVGSDAVSGPAGELMRLIGQPASALGVAQAYLGIIDGVVIERSDRELIPAIEALGMAVLCTDTIMRSQEDRDRLAAETLHFARGLR